MDDQNNKSTDYNDFGMEETPEAKPTVNKYSENSEQKAPDTSAQAQVNPNDTAPQAAPAPEEPAPPEKVTAGASK